MLMQLCAVSWRIFLLLCLLLLSEIASQSSPARIDFKLNGINGSKKNHSCHELSLEECEENAGVIFSGTIRHFQQEHKQISAVVEVKRVLKGIATIEKLTQKIWQENPVRNVEVHGLYDRSICDSEAKLNDTRIFLVNEIGTELRLNSSLVFISAYNLKRIEAAVNDKPFNWTSEEPKYPCEHVYCEFRAQCTVNASTGEPLCQCIESCDDVVSPVCGNDNITYNSECHLSMASCHKQKRIRVEYYGSCADRELCDGKRCVFGARCIRSDDGIGVLCECPNNCTDYNSSLLICGSDGRNYANVCEMEKTSCLEMRRIVKIYDGRCDPCEGILCDPRGICRVSADRQPTCLCNGIECDATYSPVCASNGQTYENECLMKLMSCRLQRKITKLFSGNCSEDHNPCKGFKCSAYSDCQLNQSEAQCVCLQNCGPIFQPVCGSNGKTYDNLCELEKNSCTIGKLITVSHNGSCKDDRLTCNRPECSHGALCVFIDNQPLCVCPSCLDEFNPVCGSDGFSYSNECMLKAINCEMKQNISMLYKGLCKTCMKECEFYAVCLLDQEGIEKCICPEFCDEVESPVCGTDNVTYNNECQLRAASCLTKKSILVMASGRGCNVCDNINCHHGSVCENGICVCPQHCPNAKTENRVCADNGVTYDSECAMHRAGCELAMDLEVHHPGECEELSGSGDVCDETTCKYNGVCVLDSNGFSECKCNFSCPAIRSTVCGSDGKTYSSECQLMEMSCKMQKLITVESIDDCEEIFEELCGGSVPLIDPTSKEEYSCTHDWKICPAGSYCHITTSCAKCCKEDGFVSSCEDTEYGCCADNVTVSLGPNQVGCPEVIMLNYRITAETTTETPLFDDNTNGTLSVFNSSTRTSLPVVKIDGTTKRIMQPNEPLEFSGASFLVNSFLQLRHQGSKSTSKFSVELTIVPNSPVGILFYTGRLDSLMGDYFSLALRDGFVEFRFDLGSGPAIIKSKERVQMNKWNRIFAQQISNHGILKLNDHEEVYGTNKGNFTILDIQNNSLFIGLAPAEKHIILKRIGIDIGFSGCFGLLNISESGRAYVHYNLTYPGSLDIERGVLHDKPCVDYAPGFDSPCQSNPCTAEGTCISFGSKNYSCICPVGRDGEKCENVKPDHSCDDTVCLYGASCIMRNGFPHCVCPLFCSPENHISSPVCGSDRRTYFSKCELQYLTCHLQINISVAYEGSCSELTTKTPVIAGLLPVIKSSATVAEIKTFMSVNENNGAFRPTMPTAAATKGLIQLAELLAYGGASFLVKSFLQLRRWRTGSTSNFSVELMIVPNSPFGILFYTGQSGNLMGDFFSLALKDGFVEFRFDLGSGLDIIKSKERVQMNKWNRIFAQQISNHGILKLNDHEEVSGTSKGNFSTLDLENNALFLGLVPIEKHIILKHIGIDIGFSGCIGLLQVSESDSAYIRYNLTYPGSPDIEKADLHDKPCVDYAPGFDSPCQSNPCAAERTCISFGSKNYSCICPAGRDGEKCENDVISTSSNSLSFDGSSFHGYYNNITERHLSQISNHYEITFRTTTKNGMLLLLHKNSTVGSNYLSIVVNDGQVEASFNQGNETAEEQKFVIKSAKYVGDGEWHNVLFVRNKAKAQISVDKEIPLTAVSSNGADLLDTDGMLWIGGTDNLINMPKSYLNKFVGCISDVKISGRTLHLIRDRKTGGHLVHCN